MRAKGVGATFCSKTEPFFSCGCSKASRVPVRPRRPKPHSAAKQACVFKGVEATFCSKTRPFFSCGCSKPLSQALNSVPRSAIKKWTLECSCVLKGVGATFCNKAGPFFSCACPKPSGVHVCPRRSKPHSAAKQGRSFRVAALSFALPSGNLENCGCFCLTKFSS